MTRLQLTSAHPGGFPGHVPWGHLHAAHVLAKSPELAPGGEPERWVELAQSNKRKAACPWSLKPEGSDGLGHSLDAGMASSARGPLQTGAQAASDSSLSSRRACGALLLTPPSFLSRGADLSVVTGPCTSLLPSPYDRCQQPPCLSSAHQEGAAGTPPLLGWT